MNLDKHIDMTIWSVKKIKELNSIEEFDKRIDTMIKDLEEYQISRKKYMTSTKIQKHLKKLVACMRDLQSLAPDVFTLDTNNHNYLGFLISKYPSTYAYIKSENDIKESVRFLKKSIFEKISHKEMVELIDNRDFVIAVRKLTQDN